MNGYTFRPGISFISIESKISSRFTNVGSKAIKIYVVWDHTEGALWGTEPAISGEFTVLMIDPYAFLPYLENKMKILETLVLSTITSALVLVGVGLVSIEVSAQSNSHTITVINKTGVVISALYVTPHSSDEWGEDILGADVLPNNNELGIVFSRKETSKLWDLRIEDSEGEFIEWENLNLREISSVTLFYKNGKATAIFNEQTAQLAGTWIGYYDDGTKSPYIWSITQNGNNLTIIDSKKSSTRSRGTVQGNSVRALDFATQNGTLAANGTRINWSDGVFWIKAPNAPDLNGVWIGYYDDGTRSPYLWNVGHVGTTITITDARAGGTTRSRGSIQGNRITALDFATKNGTLSSDGNRITWSDGVVWVRE